MHGEVAGMLVGGPEGTREAEVQGVQVERSGQGLGVRRIPGLGGLGGFRPKALSGSLGNREWEVETTSGTKRFCVSPARTEKAVRL